MYLKSLELQGFKSFADKIHLEFHDGVTAVVGPNGSGKSNISDAIRWVLGEQSAKTLRGSKMEDVIFTGTDHIKALGLAEVTLNMDNSDRSLAIDFNEVAITRRVYRSGESEYLINNTHCRLKDVYELFLDTGVGRDGYSIIGQGRIDEILSSKSEDRRNVFEEASGIMKYKVKKNEAERKLEHTSQNLLRINDIIFELQTQIDPLEQQAMTAKKYLVHRDELKDIEVSLFLQNIDRSNDKIEELIKMMHLQKGAIDSENANLSKISDDNIIKTETNRKLDLELEVHRKDFYDIEGKCERFSSEIKVNEEKISNISENIVRLNGEILELSQDLEKSGNDNTSRVKKLDYLKNQYSDFQQKLVKLEAQYSKMLDGLSTSEKEIELSKALLLDKQDVLSDKKLQAGSVRLQVEAINKRQDAIVSEIYQNKLELDKEGMLIEDLNDNIIKSKKVLLDLVGSSKDKINEKTQIASKISELSKDIDGINSVLQYKQARVKMLKDMEKNLEGYGRSVREILKRVKVDPSFGKNIHGAFAQLIHVEKRYESAIEMALGNALQNIVVSTDADAKRAIEFIKEMKLGRATFLPIEAIKGRRFEQNLLNRMEKMQGYIGVAADLVECENSYREIAESLLGRTGVVDTFENARKVSKEFHHTVKLATLDGVIFNSGGSITGGHNESGEVGLVSRNREIPQLEAEISERMVNVSNLRKDLSEYLRQNSEVEKELQSNLSNQKVAELMVIRDETHLIQVVSVVNKLKSKNDLLALESLQLNTQIFDEKIQADKCFEEIKEIELEILNNKINIDKSEVVLKERVVQRQVYYEDITNIKLSLNSISESIGGVKEAEIKSNIEKEDVSKLILKKQESIAKLKIEIDKIIEKNESILKTIHINLANKNELDLKIEKFVNLKKTIENELFGIIEVINVKNRNIQLLQEDLGKIEIKKSKLESELEVILDRLWTEYDLTTITAEPLRGEITSVTVAQKRVNELKAQIRELGTINISAIEDFVKTKERFEFMSKQRDDLQLGKEKLQKVISEMVQIMRKRFSEQFNLINKHFGEVFRELFNGGRAELAISDGANVLESGIDIIVQPPGKKIQNMMLLSGGEKALTAIALLFAILRMKPTPFCILDEIESTLDEANVNRFGSYLKDFAKETQFIIVTHRKGTMEVSNSLYGVTMQEHGVSKLVSLKLEDAHGR